MRERCSPSTKPRGLPGRLRKGRRAAGSANDDTLRAGASLRQIAPNLEQIYDLAPGVLNTLVSNVVGAYGVTIEPQRQELVEG